MTVYKLYYFNFRGFGEHVRQLFALAGQPFEDKQFSLDEYAQYKKDMIFGQVPVMEVDGVPIAQSIAIARFLGKKFGFMGEDDIENAKLDMFADLMRDGLVTDAMKQWGEMLLAMIPGDPAEHFTNKVIPAIEPICKFTEKQLSSNNTGLLVGNKVTWADVYVAEFFSKLIDFGTKDSLDSYPHIKQLIDRIHSIPSIQMHLEARGPCAY